MTIEPNADEGFPERALVDALEAETDAMLVVRDRLTTVAVMVGSDGASRLERATRDLEIASSALVTVTDLREQCASRLGVAGLSSRAIEEACSVSGRAAIEAQHVSQRAVLDEIDRLKATIGELATTAGETLIRHRRTLDSARAGEVTYHDPRRGAGSAGGFVAFSG